MSAVYYVQSALGFALQILPCALLLPLPFDGTRFRRSRTRTFLLLGATALGLSLAFPFPSYWCMQNTTFGNLFGNGFMLLSILIVVTLFFRAVRDLIGRRLIVLFTVILYAAVQFSLSNVLMDYLPLKRQSWIYNDATVAAYICVTAVLLPLIFVFLRRTISKYLQLLNAEWQRSEMVFLTVVFLFYLVLSALLSAMWVRARDAMHLSFAYYIPFILLLTVLLMLTVYSTIRLSIVKAKSAAQTLETELIKQSYANIEENIKAHKRTTHDTRQLLRTLSAIAKDGSKDELLQYIDKAIEHVQSADTRFCADPILNGIAQYYCANAEMQDVVLSPLLTNETLPFDEIDLTILLSNALENAIRSAAEFKKEYPDQPAEIRFVVEKVKEQFAIRIDNPCLRVEYASHDRLQSDGKEPKMLPAEAFSSLYAGGYGLKRMETIAQKYDGHAWFCYNESRNLFSTRLLLTMKKVKR